MRRSSNVATPATAALRVAPVNRALMTPGSFPSATQISPVKFVAVLPSESEAVTSTGGVIAAFCVALLGCTVNRSWVGGPGATVNVSLVTGWSPSVVACNL